MDPLNQAVSLLCLGRQSVYQDDVGCALVSEKASCMMQGQAQFTFEVWSYQNTYDPGSYEASATIAHEMDLGSWNSCYRMYEGTAQSNQNKTILQICVISDRSGILYTSDI